MLLALVSLAHAHPAALPHVHDPAVAAIAAGWIVAAGVWMLVALRGPSPAR